jgi:hypothetical protein
MAGRSRHNLPLNQDIIKWMALYFLCLKTSKTHFALPDPLPEAGEKYCGRYHAIAFFPFHKAHNKDNIASPCTIY